MDAAAGQLLRGEPVDVAEQLPDATFVAKPVNEEARAAWDEGAKEAGLADIETTTAEIADPFDNVPTAPPSEPAPFRADPDGTLAYHGTADDVSGGLEIGHPNRKDAGWLGEGIYATDSPAGGSLYANLKKGDAGPNVVPLRLDLKEPFAASLEDKQRLRNSSPEEIKAFTDDLKAKGHDGVVLTHPDGVKEYVVFDPKNIRSAIDPTAPMGRVRDAAPPEVQAANAIAAETPDLPVTFEDGTVTTAAEALARADADIQQAERDGSLFEAAINCFLRFGPE